MVRVLTFVVCCCCLNSIFADEVRMRIGTVEEVHRFERVAPGASVSREVGAGGDGAAILVQNVIGDDIEGHAFDMEVRQKETTLGRRAGLTSGFGRRSQCFSAPKSATTTTIQILNHSTEELLLSNVQLLPLSADTASNATAADFTLCLLVNRALSGDDAIVDNFADLRDVAGIAKAAAIELYYANLSPEEMRAQLKSLRRWCEKHKTQALVSPCSWWAGTPKEVFERPEFQQVCWSETDTLPNSPELKKLMGEKADVRYGFTVPNMWSSTPWQTMNHPELNALRKERLAFALPLVEQELKGILAGYVSENEPAYWAWEAGDYMYPVRRANLWADFNPHTVADAKKVGVILDPADGLSNSERMWLQFNAANYVQDTINVFRDAKLSAPVYSHALLGQHFPMQGTGRSHPYGEIARVRNARIGIETLRTTDMDALRRIREWGPWACVNREENDGVGLEYHLGMLMAEYMMGAELFNSYNWDTVNENDRSIRYMDEFLKCIQGGGKFLLSQNAGSGEWKPADGLVSPLVVRPDAPWANQLELSLRSSDPAATVTVALTKGVSGPVLAARTIAAGEFSTSGMTRIDFGDLTPLQQDESIVLHLAAGPAVNVKTRDSAPLYRLICDLTAERRRSQQIIRLAGGN